MRRSARFWEQSAWIRWHMLSKQRLLECARSCGRVLPPDETKAEAFAPGKISFAIRSIPPHKLERLRCDAALRFAAEDHEAIHIGDARLLRSGLDLVEPIAPARVASWRSTS